jgi:hypothetical protein
VRRGDQSQLGVGLFLFLGWGRVEIGASGLYCGEAAQTPLLPKHPLGLLETPGFVDALA